MNSGKGAKGGGREKKGANQSGQKEDKATKESSSHSHDYCCYAFSLQKGGKGKNRRTVMQTCINSSNNAAISKQGGPVCIKVARRKVPLLFAPLWQRRILRRRAPGVTQFAKELLGIITGLTKKMFIHHWGKHQGIGDE